MNRNVYLYINTGNFEEGYLAKSECSERLSSEVEAESRYSCTHCYPSSKTMTLGEFICEYKCKEPLNASRTAENRIKNTKQEYTQENLDREYNEVLNRACEKCPLYKIREGENEHRECN